MRRATTPTIEISVDQNLTGCWYRVALSQKGGTIIIKTDKDCELSDDGTVIKVPLTQEETLSFNTRARIRIQVRFGNNGNVAATDIATFRIGEILDEEIV